MVPLPTHKMLIAKYLPHYTYHEHHHTIVKATSKDCFLTAKELGMSDSWITKTLMKLRGLPTNDLKLQGFPGTGFMQKGESTFSGFHHVITARTLHILQFIRCTIIPQT